MMRRQARFLAAAMMIAVLSGPAFGLSPAERLPNPAQEQRAREIGAELRCLVCQNQSIDDSDAELAKDLRRLVRERISAGDSDRQVKDFLVARYGEFVLLRPVFSMKNLLLWTLPFLALIAGIFGVRRLFGRQVAAPVAQAALSAEEQAELDRIVAAQDSITKNS
ncbi:MAG TPA: cytochrome c-type biogenesis protein CcmH [Beijerinckiaceae bacterium]|nr:cytochrome c-type biogenesis protein CcmH [Beijerinckiaceae bacterium]